MMPDDSIAHQSNQTGAFGIEVIQFPTTNATGKGSPLVRTLSSKEGSTPGTTDSCDGICRKRAYATTGRAPPKPSQSGAWESQPSRGPNEANPSTAPSATEV